MARTVTVRLDARAIENLTEEAVVDLALEQGAERIRRRAASLAPRGRTGRLKRSLVKDKNAEGEWVVSWDRNVAFYGHLVEFGTLRTPARPFLRPAING